MDEALAAIVQRLTSHGILGNTYVVFLSDNGMLFGEHRIMRSKGGPYEESTGVPLVIRGPGVPAGASRDHLVTNADLAATFAEWAGATPPPDMDGRSLAPLLRRNAAWTGRVAAKPADHAGPQLVHAELAWLLWRPDQGPHVRALRYGRSRALRSPRGSVSVAEHRRCRVPRFRHETRRSRLAAQRLPRGSVPAAGEPVP